MVPCKGPSLTHDDRVKLARSNKTRVCVSTSQACNPWFQST